MSLGQRIQNVTKAFSDTKTRNIFIVIIVVMILAVSIGYLRLRGGEVAGPAVSSHVQRAPSITSLPGVGTPSREYVKLQEQKDIQLSEEALRKRTASVPTITRATYLNVGTTAEEGKEACSPEELRRAREAGVSATEIRCRGCSLPALRNAGFTVGELRNAGFGAKELKDLGISADALKQAGYNVKELAGAGFGAKELVQIGYSSDELKDSGFTDKELAQVGLSAVISKAVGKSCDVQELKRARAKGSSAADLKARGCSLASLKAAGFSAVELRAAGFSAKELKDAGFSAKELRDAGFSAAELKAAGFSAGELRDAGFGAEELKNAAFSSGNLRTAGFDARELKDAGFNATELRTTGFTEGDLTRAGFGQLPKPTQEYAFPSAPMPTAATSLPASPVSSVAPVKPVSDWEKQLASMREQQSSQLTAQEYQDKMKQLQQTMSAQANELFASWIPLPLQQYVKGTEEKETTVAGGGSRGGVGGAAGQGGAVVGPVDNFKAGDILFAVLDTGVNSDEKSPVMATIVSGPLKDAKVLGTFQRVDKKVVLQFTVLSVPKLTKSVSINAVAIDPDTARTALATSVDNHYMLKYGGLFAASFVSGLGQAVQDSANSISVNTASGENINFHGSMNLSKAAVIGMGSVGNKFADVLTPLASKPPTVEVKAGLGLGLLLMSDLAVPKY